MATLPTPLGYKSLEIKSTFPGTKSVTDTGAVQRVNYSGHFFDFQIVYPPMKRAQHQQITAFIQGMQGGLTAFDMPMDERGTSIGYVGTATTRPADDNLYVDTAHTQGDTDINYRSSWTNTYYTVGSNGNFLEIGDYIQFANHTKLYQIIAITNPDATGDGQITISPPLQQDVADAVILGYEDITPRVFLNDKMMSYSIGVCGFSEIALNLKEEV